MRAPKEEMTDTSRGLPPGQYANGADAPVARLGTADGGPHPAAFLFVQGFQLDRPEQLEHGLTRMIDLLEAAGGGGQQHDPRLVQERMSQHPALVVVHLLTQQHVEILDDQQHSLAL